MRAGPPGGVSGTRRGRPLPTTVRLPDFTPGLALRGAGSRPYVPGCPCPQEVAAHCGKLTRKNREQLAEMMVLDKQKGLKSLSKEKRQKLEAYQHLLYLLQVRGGPGRDHPRLRLRLQSAALSRVLAPRPSIWNVLAPRDCAGALCTPPPCIWSLVRKARDLPPPSPPFL